jgi:hypothetical protein
MAKEVETGCPVCGYPEFAPFDELGWSTLEICPCCGGHAGVDYTISDNLGRLADLRRRWLGPRKAEWRSPVMPSPPGWDPLVQVKDVGLINRRIKSIRRRRDTAGSS